LSDASTRKHPSDIIGWPTLVRNPISRRRRVFARAAADAGGAGSAAMAHARIQVIAADCAHALAKAHDISGAGAGSIATFDIEEGINIVATRLLTATSPYFSCHSRPRDGTPTDWHAVTPSCPHA